MEALQGRGDPLAADKRQIGEEYEGFRLKKRPLPRREELQESFRLKKSDPTKEDHDGFRLKKIPDDSVSLVHVSVVRIIKWAPRKGLMN